MRQISKLNFLCYSTSHHKFIPPFYTSCKSLLIIIQGLISRLPIGAARAVAFGPSGELLAVGMKTGELIVITLPSMKIWAKKRDRNSCINDIR